MKTIALLLFFFIGYEITYSQYISSTVEQVSAPTITSGSVNNTIIRIKIDVGPNPIDLYALFLNSAGSTNPSTNIDSAKLFYTGSSTVFSISTQYGHTILPPISGITSTFPLSSGDNYFWLTYDISQAAITCDTMDATCYTVYATGGTATPTLPNPAGYALIGSCITGMNDEYSEHDNNLLVFPNPFTEQIIIKYPEMRDVSSVKREVILFDVMGKEIVRQNILNFRELTYLKINTEFLNPGVYLLHYAEGNKSANTKLVKF